MSRRLPAALGAAAALLALAAPARAQQGSPAGPVPVERLAARRAALAARMGTGVAILRSAEERSIERDYPQDSDYREKNDFFYLTGIEEPDAWLLLVADSGRVQRAALWLKPRVPAQERWTGVRLGPGPEAAALTGIDELHPADSAEAQLRAAVQRATFTLRGGALFTERTREAGDDAFVRRLGFGATRDEWLLPLRSLTYEVAQLRLVKDDDELRRERGAVTATTASITDALRALKPGMWEYEIEAMVEAGFRRRGAERVGYPSIIGSGPNSVTLHYDKNRRRTEAGDLVVMDVGAEYGYFSADVTRTVPVSGRFTPRQRAIYDLVLATQQAAIDSVRPGVTVGDLNRIARAYMKAHSDTLCGPQTCDAYFVHGLSHWLGMDVHDVGDYRTPLAPGMVITVEPGIYLPDENLGVRIEDDVLVTAGGHELLSAGAPRAAADIERTMAGKDQPAGRRK